MMGGGSLLNGICERIQNETKLKVKRASDPLSCVADGTGKVLKKLKLIHILDLCLTNYYMWNFSDIISLKHWFYCRSSCISN